MFASRLARRLESVDEELSDRVIRWSTRSEAAIPSSRRIERFLREQAPDVVLVSSVVRHGSEEVELLKSARRLGIPSGVCIASWDNLTNKGLIKFVPDRVFVWNEAQAAEATELHGIPADRVRATGAGLFDEWFERQPTRTAEEFARAAGLEPARPFVVYFCSSPPIARNREADFVREWIAAVRADGDERVRGLGVLVRPHPRAASQWRETDLSDFGNAVVWPRAGAYTVGDRERDDFFDTLVHSAAAVGINTTAMIEAAVVGKSVLTVLRPEFAQESTLHFHHLLAENGGFLHVADALPEHVTQLGVLLSGDDTEQRRAFVERFVRPEGLERPATPILADAVEELASVSVTHGEPRSPILRAGLGVEAALSSVHAARRVPRAAWDRHRRRVEPGPDASVRGVPGTAAIDVPDQ
jgi:hypothetical protein